jgi:hypothetical protein
VVSGFGVDQESLFEPYAVVPEHRVEALAGVLAGFGWPERGSFEKLTKGQQRICREAAREALLALKEET